MRKYSRAGAGACCLLAVALAAGAAAAANFSQRTGFEAWREQVRRTAAVPTPAGRARLARHRPRFLLPPGHPGPLDFYRDYVASGVLRDGSGEALPGPVDRALLNAHADDPEAVFSHLRGRVPPPGPPAVYGRVDRVVLPELGPARALSVLTWHMVFRTSGLPAGVDGMTGLLAGLAGDLDDWHQLDHYTAASLVLDADGRPLALMLQQHNYTRTWLIGEGYDLPADGRPVIDVAVRSNELYPHRAGRHWRRAVRFADADGVRHLMGFGREPLMAAADLTEGVREADYVVEYLPTDDAFYRFQGYLGERRLLPGRDGPPGAGYNTVPELKPLEIQLFVGYWREGSREDLERFERLAVAGGDRVAFAEAQRRVFLANVECLRADARACR